MLDERRADLRDRFRIEQVPPQPAFFEQINFYRTCLNKMTHATGHAKRLARDLTNWRFAARTIGAAFQVLAADRVPIWVIRGFHCCNADPQVDLD